MFPGDGTGLPEGNGDADGAGAVLGTGTLLVDTWLVEVDVGGADEDVGGVEVVEVAAEVEGGDEADDGGGEEGADEGTALLETAGGPELLLGGIEDATPL